MVLMVLSGGVFYTSVTLTVSLPELVVTFSEQQQVFFKHDDDDDLWLFLTLQSLGVLQNSMDF